jgi:hypothetical protein
MSPRAEPNRFFARLAAAPTASGGIVMAIGIAAIAALPNARPSSALLQQALGLFLIALWAFLAAAYAAAWREGGFARHTSPPVGRFAIGTWVAATAVLCRLVTLRFPEWRWLSALLANIALLLWLWFLPAMLSGFRAIAAGAARVKATGIVLLSTVSTQSLAIVLLSLFREGRLVFALVLALVVLGYGLYGLAASLVVERYWRDKGWRLADDWDNSNCILHGAMSISGLAAVLGGVFPPIVPLVTWIYAAIAFLLVEAIEVARLSQRLHLYGLFRGVLAYDVSQWSRNFTFGMFYAFTLAFMRHLPQAAVPSLVRYAQAAVAGFGQYVVLALLAAEIAIFAASLCHKRLS